MYTDGDNHKTIRVYTDGDNHKTIRVYNDGDNHKTLSMHGCMDVVIWLITPYVTCIML